MDIKERVFYYINEKGTTAAEFERNAGLSNGYLKNLKASIGTDKINSILSYYDDISLEWLIKGEGNMLRDDIVENPNPDIFKNLIPLYDDTISVGGYNELVANVDIRTYSNEWIDAGDWFNGATAAIKHYGTSMIEYPSGCILVIQDVKDFEHVVFGRNYVVETDEYRVTKRLQRGKPGRFRLYSTNEETYSDGHLINEPLDVSIGSIRRISLVLGYVVKQYASKEFYITK